MVPMEPEKRRLRDSVVFKMVVIGLLILILLIPLAMVRSLVTERQNRQQAVATEVAASWGESQTLGGPVLTVPFLTHSKDEKGKVQTWTSFAYFLPETLKVTAEVVPERRNRGIFEVAVYRADTRWTGTFKRPSFAEWRIDPKDVLWQDAHLSVGVPDMRGIRRGLDISWGDKNLQLTPGGAVPELWTSGLRVAVPDLGAGKEGQSYAFSFDLGINGSQTLKFLPLAKQNAVSVKSSWPSPSFSGAFLPEEREVSGMGFEALWNVSWLGRSYPQQWRQEEVQQVASCATVSASAFGVDLFLPVDAYQKTERSVKYGVLFLVLTFMTFFLYEVMNRFTVHAVQYLLVGFALCLFYVLLLSISEHMQFAVAYGVASAATVLLIGGYSAAILRGRLRALMMTGVLGLLYGYLYVLLQLEDYALLLGSVGLFLILGLVMYLTRKIDWSGSRGSDSPVPAAVTNP